MDESKVTMKGRLGPGMMIAVDLPGGQVCAHFSFFFCT
jgi:glutamate synthase (ferredoxin)